MTKSTLYSTMQLIADILCFNNNQAELSKYFKQTAINWDNIVVEASKHLMLPALYYKLKTKELLELIPPDLAEYLEEIAAINRGRNEVLLIEAREISEIFKNEDIDYVIIKGVALLAGQIFKDQSERMIGDMDILIPPTQIHKAYRLLEQQGYTENVGFNYQPKNYRHLSRQINPNRLAAIELHSDILIHKHRGLVDSHLILENKIEIDGINVPRFEDSIRIAIFSSQINNHAHLFSLMDMKTIYDCLSIGLQHNRELLKSLSNQKYSQSFLALSSVFFTEFRPFNTNSFSRMMRSYFCFKINHPKIGRFVHRTFTFLHSILLRLNLLISNKSYRIHILKHKILVKKN